MQGFVLPFLFPFLLELTTKIKDWTHKNLAFWGTEPNQDANGSSFASE